MTFEGRYLQVVDAQLRMPPLQREKLPVWVGAQGPKGIAQAAQLGDEWLVSPEVPLETIAERQLVYRKALPSDVDPAGKLFPILREAYAAGSREHARRIAEPALETKYAAYASWGHIVGSFDDMADSAFVLGSVDDCVESVERYRTTLSTGFLGMRMQWPGLGQREVLESIGAFAEVIARCQD